MEGCRLKPKSLLERLKGEPELPEQETKSNNDKIDTPVVTTDTVDGLNPDHASNEKEQQTDKIAMADAFTTTVGGSTNEILNDATMINNFDATVFGTDCLKMLDEALVQTELMKLQIIKINDTMNTNVPEEKESGAGNSEVNNASQINEKMASIRQKEKMLDYLLELLAEKNEAFKVVAKDFETKKEEITKLLQNKIKEAETLRALYAGNADFSKC